MPDSWIVKSIGLVPLLPLVACIVTAVLGPRILRERSHWPCLVAALAAAAFALVIFFSVVAMEPVAQEGEANQGPPAVLAATHVPLGYYWITVGRFDVALKLRVDPLTALMLVMVTGVGSLIVIYAVGYMHGDEGYWRFFTYVALFLSSMCMLVLASNFLLLFLFWEAVGLCSYLLIGFWYRRPAAAAAAKKAFLVNRIGDFGFTLGILMVYLAFSGIPAAAGTSPLDYDHAFQHAGEVSSGMMLAICLLLFCGAVGKSAQFPLHVWLPDAMEGPTPVSALIHAATMVTAGVYMVARMTPLFVQAPAAQVVVSCVGGVTAFIAAFIALSQHDLKRILAYSTVSQLGYMFLALGCGSAFAVAAAIFHVFTHAFFKALLFLGAGSVMHAMGNVIDIRAFSGLRHKLPTTHWTFACGAASLAGLPLLSGFWSKDEILGAVAARATGAWGWLYGLLLLLGIVTAFMTAFYTFRAFFRTFWGPEKYPEHVEHVHESPPVMYVPLIALAVFALFLGLIIRTAIGPFLYHTPGLTEHAEHTTSWGLMITSGILALAGTGLAWVMYGQQSTLPEQLATRLGSLYRLSLNKMWFDEIYNLIVVRPALGAAAVCRFVDNWIVDGAVQLVALVPRVFSWMVLQPIQNGLVQFYALGMMMGMVMLLIFMLFN